MMHSLITGGMGFIGSHLAEKLLERGDIVTVIDDLSTGSLKNISHLIRDERFRFAVETITNETVMDRLVSECDIIYHLAAAVGVELIIQKPVHVIEANIIGTEYVLKIANRYKKKVLIASTSEIYGKNNKVPFDEDDDCVFGATTKNRWSYACSKAIDEFLALAYCNEAGLPVIICRFFNTVGVRQTGRYGMVMPRFIRQASLGEDITVYGSGKQSRCFANVKDVIKAVIALSETPEAVGQVYNIGTAQEITIAELARRILEITESKSNIRYIPYDKAYEKGFEDMMRRIPSIEKIKKTIGWTPQISCDETIREMVEYVRNEVKEVELQEQEYFARVVKY